MAKTSLLRIERSDGQGFVLINVEQTGVADLDVQLVGTDGSAPFVARIKQKNVIKLRNASYDGSNEDWTWILHKVLLSREDTSESSPKSTNIETRATISENAINVDIRNNIGGITQRLGSIELSLDEEQEIALFNWAGEATSTCHILAAEHNKLHKSMLDQKLIIEKLNAQLDDLVKAKAEHEDVLIKKFAELLNAKKAKIRDLLRHQTSSDGRVPSLPHRTKESRPGKRKVEETAADEESDDGFETAQTDARQPHTASDESDGDAQQTPDASDSDEMEDDARKEQVSQSRASAAKTDARKKSSGPPPKRDLPFGKRDITAQSESAHAEALTSAPGKQEVEDDETDDEDEL